MAGLSRIAFTEDPRPGNCAAVALAALLDKPPTEFALLKRGGMELFDIHVALRNHGLKPTIEHYKPRQRPRLGVWLAKHMNARGVVVICTKRRSSHALAFDGGILVDSNWPWRHWAWDSRYIKARVWSVAYVEAA